MNENIQQEKKNNQRIEWIDTVKSIAIFWVILLHLNYVPTYLVHFMTPFVLATFFFCSGYVYEPTSNFKDFLYKKFRSLFMPWLFFSNLNIILSQIISFNEQEKFSVAILKNILQIRAYGDNVWFVAAIFLAFIPFYFIINTEYKHSKEQIISRRLMLLMISFILSFISLLYCTYMDPSFFPWHSVALPWHIEYIFQGVLFMVFGYYYKVAFSHKKMFLNNSKSIILLLIVYIISIFISELISSKSILFILFNYIIKFSGVFLVVNLSKIIKSNKFISFIGQNTLIYFAIHGKAISLIQTLLVKILGNTYYVIMSNILSATLVLVLITLIVLLLLIYPIILIRKYLSFLFTTRKAKLY